jgi:FixJ family two-component response regulator
MNVQTLPSGTVHIIESSRTHPCQLTDLILSMGLPAVCYECIDDFLLRSTTNDPGCVVLEVSLTHSHAATLDTVLGEFEGEMPVVVIADFNDVPTSVRAMKAGAANYLIKPCSSERLLQALIRAIESNKPRRRRYATDRVLRNRYLKLDCDEKAILDAVIKGKMNKQIAWDLLCCERTVKTRRSQLMRKFEARSITELVWIWKQLEPEISRLERSDTCGPGPVQSLAIPTISSDLTAQRRGAQFIGSKDPHEQCRAQT